MQPYKDGGWEEAKVKLCKERLLVLKRDIVYEDTLANNEFTDQKRITLQRDDEGRLGVVIMGGLDYKSPIKIYRLLEGTPAQRCRELYEHDVIMQVNDTPTWGLSHDQAVEMIRQMGNEVTFHTARLQLREIEDQVSVDEQWLTLADIPLQMASISRYQTGTDILRLNGFEVVSGDGRSKVSLRCGESNPQEVDSWIMKISKFILRENAQQTERYNNNLSRDEQIVRMGWVYEQVPSTIHSHTWQRKFLALRREQIQLYATIPESVAEWERAEKQYNLLEMTLKVLEPHSISEQRANSLILTSGTGDSHVISCESKEGLLDWTLAIHYTTVEAVNRVAQVKYPGRWRDRDVDLVMDINEGIILQGRNNPSNILWKKPFSYLQQSSDDGHSKLKLKCAIRQSKITETQDIELHDLQLAICSLECFVTAKVAALDPDFIQQHTDLIAY